MYSQYFYFSPWIFEWNLCGTENKTNPQIEVGKIRSTKNVRQKAKQNFMVLSEWSCGFILQLFGVDILLLTFITSHWPNDNKNQWFFLRKQWQMEPLNYDNNKQLVISTAITLSSFQHVLSLSISKRKQFHWTRDIRSWP